MPKRRTSRYATSAPVSRSTVARRCVSAGRSPVGAWRNEPVIRRWTTSVRPLARRQSRYLPRRSTRRHRLADEPVGDDRRVERPRQAGIDDLGALDRGALEHRHEPAADGLDLGQLGHAAIVGTAPRRPRAQLDNHPQGHPRCPTRTLSQISHACVPRFVPTLSCGIESARAESTRHRLGRGLGSGDGSVGDVRLLRHPRRLERGHRRCARRRDAARALPQVEPLVQARTPAGATATCSVRRHAGLGVDADPAASLPEWPVFDDVRDALERRGRGWLLGILTNSDRDLIEASIQSIGVPFDLVIAASEIGSYKPAPHHWDAFADAIGRLPDVHVAQSHFHDVVPATALGIPTIWVNRLGETPGPPPPSRELPTSTVSPTRSTGLRRPRSRIYSTTSSRIPRSGGASLADLVGGEHRRGGPLRRRVVPCVHLGEVVAREHGVAALREAEDADRVVDRVGLRAAPRAELERGDADVQCADPRHDAVRGAGTRDAARARARARPGRGHRPGRGSTARTRRARCRPRPPPPRAVAPRRRRRRDRSARAAARRRRGRAP